MPTLSKRSLVALFVVGAFLIAALVLVYFVYLSPTGLKARENADLRALENANKVPAYTNLDGTPTDLTEFDGEILIVNLWASWSPFTPQDLDLLSAAKKTYGDRITIRAVDRMEEKGTAEAYLSTIGKRDGIEYVIDTTDHLYKSLDGYAMPETIFFDAIGNVKVRIRGTLNEDELRQTIDSLVAPKP